jgi:hypothetical protein
MGPNSVLPFIFQMLVIHEGFEVITAVTMKTAALFYLTPCSLVDRYKQACRRYSSDRHDSLK